MNTNQDQNITVMTRNLYLGADLGPVVAAAATGDPSVILPANSLAWENVKATNFPERAQALADEIKQTKPLLVGLQEVSLWRSGPPDSFSSPPGTPPNADKVEFDYLAILLKELNKDKQGPQYTPVVSNTNFDLESVNDTDLTDGIDPDTQQDDLRDIRLTDHDVILARTDLPRSELKLSHVQKANFDNNSSFSIGGTGQSVPILRGWTSVDVTSHDKKFRFINTHLEAENPDPAVNAIQVLQGNEILDGPASTTNDPVILAGDYNSRADRTGTLTYGNLIEAGFADAWSITHPGDSGYTCCQAADLRNTTSTLDQRIDLVLFRKGKSQDIQAFDAKIIGEKLVDRTPSGLWPSDHAGLVATLR